MSLISRLRDATGPDRELDAEIHVRVHGWKLSRVPKDYDGKNDGETYTPDGEPIPGFCYPPKGKIGLYYHVPRNGYTASMDSALMLFPSGQYPIEICGQQVSVSGEKIAARTPALALCIAALLARGIEP